MSDLQPWRNPRPAPHLPDAQILAKQFPPLGDWLRSWWPALLWAGVIFTMSTDTFSADHTGKVIWPVLHLIYPTLTDAQFSVIHYFIRKSAHFTEYFVFAVLLYRGIRGQRPGWRWTWGLSALGLAAVYAALDEIHQAFIASRTASAYDSLLDSVGAVFAIAFLFLWFRLRAAKPKSSV